MTDAPLPTTPAAPRGRTGRYLPHVLVVISAFLFAWTIREGRVLDLHHLIPHSIDKHETSIAVAISELRYGLNQGYCAYWNVHNALRNGGLTDSPYLIKKYGYKYPENMRDQILIDKLLDEAANIPDVASQGVMYCPIYAEDVGYADYAKIGFRLFGYKISSLFTTFFLVLGVSLAAYLLAYRRDVPMLLLLVAFQIAFFLVVRSIPLLGDNAQEPSSTLQLGSVTNGRFLSTLGLIPFLHLAGCIRGWPRATFGHLVPALVQAVVLGFSLHLRGSGLALVIALGGLVALPALAWGWRHWRTPAAVPVSVVALARAAAAYWPVALILLAAVGQKAYLSSAVHWSYKSDHGLPQHLLWHNALIALDQHPEWDVQAISPGEKYRNDALGIAAVEKRLDEDKIGKEFLVSQLTRNYKARLHDEICKTLYVDFAKSHPRYMAELMLWYKPKAIWFFAEPVGRTTLRGLLRADALCFLAAFVVCLGIAVRNPGHAPGLRSATVIAGVGFLGTLLPLFWAYPCYHVLSEFVVLGLLLAVFGGLALTRTGARLLDRVTTAAGTRFRLRGVGQRAVG